MRLVTFIDKQSLSISDLQIDYLYFENSVINIERENFSSIKVHLLGSSHPTEKIFKQHRKDKVYKKSPLN